VHDRIWVVVYLLERGGSSYKTTASYKTIYFGYMCYYCATELSESNGCILTPKKSNSSHTNTSLSVFVYFFFALKA